MSENAKYTLSELLADGFNGTITQGIDNVPIIGGFIRGVLNGIEQKRLEEFINNILLKIQQIGRDKLDLKYIQSDEFHDLIALATRIRIYHRCMEKAKILTQIITDSIHIDRSKQFQTDFKESFINLINLLSLDEMNFLSAFTKSLFAEKSREDFYKSPNTALPIALDGLISKGLFCEDDTWNKHVIMTKLGEKFIDYLQYLQLK